MISFLLILFGLSMVYAATTSRLDVYVKVLAFQGGILFLLILGNYRHTEMGTFIFLAFETLVVKTLSIPLFLSGILRKNALWRETSPAVPHFYSVLTTTFFFLLGLLAAHGQLAHAQDLKPLYFGVSVSTILSALLLMIIRKKIITHVMGYMMLENGIFLLSLSVAREMPLVVNAGVLLDVFAGIFLLGLFVTRIQTVFEALHVDELRNLRD